MKKYNLFKILLIGFFIVVALTWIIPAATVTSGAIESSKLSPIGVLDIFRILILTLGHYLQYGVLILAIGVFYGILNNAGGYQNLINYFEKGFKKIPKTFLMLTFTLFMLLSAIGGNHFVLLILVPFFVTVLFKLKYSKLVAMLATFGAIIFGNFASIYGFEVSGYINYFLELDVNYNILVKIALFLLTLGLAYILSENFGILEPGKKANKEIPLYIDKKDKKSFWPIAILIDVVVIFLLIATYNWKFGANSDFFIDLHQRVLDFEILGVSIFQSVVGKVESIGFYNLSDVAIILLFVSAVVAIFNKMKIDETIDSAMYGLKEVVKPAAYIVLANIVLGAATFVSPTFLHTLTFYTVDLFKDSVLIVSVFLPILAGIFTNSVSFFISVFSEVIKSGLGNNDSNFIIGLGFQMFHSAIMLILPTSMIIIAGLTYLDVSFKEWVKFSHKYVYALFALAFSVVAILTIIL